MYPFCYGKGFFSHSCDLMSFFLPIRANGGRAAAFILRCRIESSWLAGRQTDGGGRPFFSWMTHSVVLHYWDPETITLLSRVPPQPPLSRNHVWAGKVCRGKLLHVFTPHTMGLIGDRREEKEEDEYM